MMRQQHSPLMALIAPLLLSCSPAANAAADGAPPDDVVEGAPAVLKKDVKKEEAEEIKAKLAAVGAVVALE